MRKSSKLNSFFTFLLIIGSISIFSSCTSNDKVWELEIGQSRKSVVSKLTKLGYEVENFSADSYISINEKIKYQGITWNNITCWFDKNNKLKSVEFVSYYPLSFSELDKLGKYIQEEGYPELTEDPKCKGFYMSDKLPMTVMLSLPYNGVGLTKLEYCKDAHKHSN